MNVTQELIDTIKWLRANRERIIQAVRDNDEIAWRVVMVHKMWVTMRNVAIQSHIIGATNSLRRKWGEM